MAHILVSDMAEVAANCYFRMHTQFSTSPDTAVRFHCLLHTIQDKQFTGRIASIAHTAKMGSYFWLPQFPTSSLHR